MNPIPNNIFFENVEDIISEGQNVKITVQGTSMSPFFKSGTDNVLLVPVTADLRRGDIVLFKINDTVKLHRIIHIRGTLLLIRGDGCYGRYEKATTSDVIAIVSEGSYFGGKKHFTAASAKWRIISKIWVLSYPCRNLLRLTRNFLFR